MTLCTLLTVVRTIGRISSPGQSFTTSIQTPTPKAGEKGREWHQINCPERKRRQNQRDLFPILPAFHTAFASVRTFSGSTFQQYENMYSSQSGTPMLRQNAITPSGARR